MGKLSIKIGNIVSDEILEGHDLIVNPTNSRMLCGGGVCGAIFYKAGVEQLENYTQSTYNISEYSDDNLMEVGDIRITPGFQLNMDIMFVQGPYHWGYSNSQEVLMDVYKKLLNEAYVRGYHHVLLPSLGTGVYGFLHKNVGKEVSNLIIEFIKDKDIDIDLILYEEEDKAYYMESNS